MTLKNGKKKMTMLLGRRKEIITLLLKIIVQTIGKKLRKGKKATDTVRVDKVSIPRYKVIWVKISFLSLR